MPISRHEATIRWEIQGESCDLAPWSRRNLCFQIGHAQSKTEHQDQSHSKAALGPGVSKVRGCAMLPPEFPVGVTRSVSFCSTKETGIKSL